MNYAKPAKLYAKRLRYLSFQEFVDKYGLKNEATSNVKIQQILINYTYQPKCICEMIHAQLIQE